MPKEVNRYSGTIFKANNGFDDTVIDLNSVKVPKRVPVYNSQDGQQIGWSELAIVDDKIIGQLHIDRDATGGIEQQYPSPDFVWENKRSCGIGGVTISNKRQDDIIDCLEEMKDD